MNHTLQYGFGFETEENADEFWNNKNKIMNLEKPERDKIKEYEELKLKINRLENEKKDSEEREAVANHRIAILQDEVVEMRALLNEAKKELKAKNVNFNS